jgi:hypothetical protein
MKANSCFVPRNELAPWDGIYYIGFFGNRWSDADYIVLNPDGTTFKVKNKERIDYQYNNLSGDWAKKVSRAEALEGLDIV